jgi:hypothetical protein
VHQRAAQLRDEHRGGAGAHRGDPRYAFGLMSAKRRAATGWRDVVPAPPRALGSADAPGPWLVLPGGRLAEPYGTRIALGRRGAILVHGGFRLAHGRVVRRRVTFTFAPTPGGAVRVSFPVRRRDRIELADFRRAGAAPEPVRVTLRPAPRGDIRVLASAPEVRSGYASATVGRTIRVAGRVVASRAGTLTWRPRG